MRNFWPVLVLIVFLASIYLLSRRTNIKLLLHLPAIGLALITVTLPALAWIGYAQSTDLISVSGFSVANIPIWVIVLLIVAPIFGVYIWGIIQKLVAARQVSYLLPIIFLGAVIGSTILALYSGAENSVLFATITTLVSATILLLSQLIYSIRFWAYSFTVIVGLFIGALLTQIFSSLSFSNIFNFQNISIGLAYLSLFLVAYDWFDRKITHNKKVAYMNNLPGTNYLSGVDESEDLNDNSFIKQENDKNNPVLGQHDNDHISQQGADTNSSKYIKLDAKKTTTNKRSQVTAQNKINYYKISSAVFFSNLIKKLNSNDSSILDKNPTVSGASDTVELSSKLDIKKSSNKDELLTEQAAAVSYSSTLVSPDFYIPHNKTKNNKKSSKKPKRQRFNIFKANFKKLNKNNDSEIGLQSSDFIMPEFYSSNSLSQVDSKNHPRVVDSSPKLSIQNIKSRQYQPVMTTNLALQRNDFSTSRVKNQEKQHSKKSFQSNKEKILSTPSTNKQTQEKNSSKVTNKYQKAFEQSLKMPKMLAEPEPDKLLK